MTGQELHELLLAKWGYSYDIQLRRTQGKVFVQVMWRYLEQASFPMTATEYREHLDAVAAYINGWSAAQHIVEYIQATRDRPRLGKVVSIPVPLGGRASEWMVEKF
jgi:hypothetical protein